MVGCVKALPGSRQNPAQMWQYALRGAQCRVDVEPEEILRMPATAKIQYGSLVVSKRTRSRVPTLTQIRMHPTIL